MVLGSDEPYDVWNKFIKIKDSVGLLSFVKDRAFKHDKYSHYSKIEAINKIFDTQTIWLTKSTELNDKWEGVGASEEVKEKTYVACFSHEISENLSEWVLYGDKGYGGRISFQNANIIRNITAAKDIKTVDQDMGCDYKSIVATDIIYYTENNGTDENKKVSLYYDDCKNVKINYKNFNAIRNEMPFAFKPMIWRYEHETRIIITLNNAIKDKRVKVSFGDMGMIRTAGPMLDISSYADSQFKGMIRFLL